MIHASTILIMKYVPNKKNRILNIYSIEILNIVNFYKWRLKDIHIQLLCN